MSRLIPDYDDPDLGLGDIVEFDAPKLDRRMQGEVVRVYVSHAFYHVLADGKRYEIAYPDNLRLIRKKGA